MENQQAKPNSIEGLGLQKQYLEVTQGQFRRDCRKLALQTAEHINPIERNYAQLGGQVTKPSVDTLLKDADKIYEWLITA